MTCSVPGSVSCCGCRPLYQGGHDVLRRVHSTEEKAKMILFGFDSRMRENATKKCCLVARRSRLFALGAGVKIIDAVIRNSLVLAFRRCGCH